jgi:hypothetical protein
VFWVISEYFNIRNTLPKSGTFLLGHPVYVIVILHFNILLHNIDGRGGISMVQSTLKQQLKKAQQTGKLGECYSGCKQLICMLIVVTMNICTEV